MPALTPILVTDFVEAGIPAIDGNFTALNAAASVETSARTSADTSLATSITAEASSRTAADASLTTALSAEVSLTSSRDTSLATAISSGDTSLTAALSTAISAEAGTRSTADSSLATRISTLEGAGGGDVSIEASVRASADTSLTTRLGTEESARGTGDSSLTTRISTEESVRASAVTSLASVVTTADSSLTTRISAEESTRTAADASLTTRLGTEESTRGTADSSLTTRISIEESVRASVDTSLAAAISAGGMTNPMTTAGDLIVGGTAGAPGRLAIGASGKVLGVSAGAPAWVDQTGGSGGVAKPDPLKISIFEDFLRCNTAYLAGHPLVVNYTSGTGAAVNASNTTSFAGHHGHVSLSTGTTTTGYAGVIGGQQSNFSSWPELMRSEVSAAEWRVIFRTPDSLSDGTETYSLFVGLPAGASSVAGGAGISYTHSANSGKFEIMSRQASLSSADSGVTVAAATWYNLLCSYDGTSLTFTLNGTSIGSISTNLPTNFCGPGCLITKSAGTTARLAYVDYVSLYAEVTR